MLRDPPIEVRAHLHSLCALGRHTEFGNLQAILSDLRKVALVHTWLLSFKCHSLFLLFGGALACAGCAQPNFDGSFILSLLHAAL
jgi:hypothetical protein